MDGDTNDRARAADAPHPTPTLQLGCVPLDVAQKWLDELNRVIAAGYGTVETEVRDRRVFVRPRPSYEFELA